jgi:hypothetical protein
MGGEEEEEEEEEGRLGLEDGKNRRYRHRPILIIVLVVEHEDAVQDVSYFRWQKKKGPWS